MVEIGIDAGVVMQGVEPVWRIAGVWREQSMTDAWSRLTAALVPMLHSDVCDVRDVRDVRVTCEVGVWPTGAASIGEMVPDWPAECEPAVVKVLQAEVYRTDPGHVRVLDLRMTMQRVMREGRLQARHVGAWQALESEMARMRTPKKLVDPEQRTARALCLALWAAEMEHGGIEPEVMVSMRRDDAMLEERWYRQRYRAHAPEDGVVRRRRPWI